MHNAEAAIEPAFYDHEDEVVQRDRAAADWGSDEVFASVPRRRFRGDHPAGAVSAHRRSAVQRPGAPAPESDDAAKRAAWLAEVEAELAAAPEPPADPAPALSPEALTEGV